jgi:hypothetical protein
LTLSYISAKGNEIAEAYRNEKFQMKGMKRINYIRNVNPLAYGYLVESFRLLHEAGYFTKSIL